MKIAELLRSSSFRLSLIYMVLFAGSVLFLLGFIYWATVGFMARQTDATVEAEITGLAEQYREGGVGSLINILQERIERDPDSSSSRPFPTRRLFPSLSASRAFSACRTRMSRPSRRLTDRRKRYAPSPSRPRMTA